MQRFFRQLGSLIISLTLATLVWLAAINEQNPPREDNYNQAIPIEVIPPAEGLVTTDKLPDVVRLHLRAPQSNWLDLTPAKFKATLDLSHLPVGFSQVPVQVVVSDPQVEIIEKKPPDVSVNLQVEQVITLPVQIDIMDTPPLGYINRTPTAEPDTILVKGPESVISQVNKAVAPIFIRNAKETIENMSEVLLHDRDGQQLTGLEISPSKVRITLPIEQRFGYKDVSVRAMVIGQVAPGYRVSNILVDPPTLTIVGNPRVLNSIAGFVETAQIDLSQATQTIARTVPLNLPDGVSVVAPEKPKGPGGVQVTVEIAAIEDGITLKRPIMQQGIDPDYSWQASPDRADVFLSGPIPQLQTLKASDVEVIVNLFGLEPGVHKVKPTVFLPDGFRLNAILPDTIEVTIGLVPTSTPTPTPTPALPPTILRFAATPTPTVRAAATP